MKADIIVYNYFLQKLHENIRSFGYSKMDTEIQALRKTHNYWQNVCTEKQEETPETKNYRFRESAEFIPMCAKIFMKNYNDKNIVEKIREVLTKKHHKI